MMLNNETVRAMQLIKLLTTDSVPHHQMPSTVFYPCFMQSLPVVWRPFDIIRLGPQVMIDAQMHDRFFPHWQSSRIQRLGPFSDQIRVCYSILPQEQVEVPLHRTSHRQNSVASSTKASPANSYGPWDTRYPSCRTSWGSLWPRRWRLNEFRITATIPASTATARMRSTLEEEDIKPSHVCLGSRLAALAVNSGKARTCRYPIPIRNPTLCYAADSRYSEPSGPLSLLYLKVHCSKTNKLAAPESEAESRRDLWQQLES